jgi:hypothetical protein
MLNGRHVAVTTVAAFGLMLAFTAGKPRAHDQYHDWKIPGSDTSCCNDSDCRPVRAKFEQDIWWAYLDGMWVPIPPANVLPPGTSRDGRSHYCGANGLTFCFAPGEVRS